MRLHFSDSTIQSISAFTVMHIMILAFGLGISLPLTAGDRESYPVEWWAPADPATAPSWEILPQEAGEGEVILSKRTELGIFSNFAATPFTLDEHKFASVEGFWQMMKFPDTLIENDPRSAAQFLWTHTRDQVGSLSAFEAKDAGNEGSAVMKTLEINWVSYLGKKMEYRTQEKGEHFELIRKAMRAKLDQTEGLKDLLLSTGDLKLLPDHDQGENPPPAWKYFKIWTDFREELKDELKVSFKVKSLETKK